MTFFSQNGNVLEKKMLGQKWRETFSRKVVLTTENDGGGSSHNSEEWWVDWCIVVVAGFRHFYFGF